MFFIHINHYATSRFALCLAILLPGCIHAPPAKTPMTTWFYTQPAKNNRDLIVLLPGINERPTAYEKRGFIDELRHRGLDVDLVAADAHFGYFKARSVVDRLKADVINPAKEKGYTKIWLVGISLGGLGSLLYAMEHPNDIEGVLVLAPYLGETALIRQIKKAGGPLQWQPALLQEDGGLDRLWIWLKNYHTHSANLPTIYLGYGRQDKFSVADSLLAGLLPPQQVYVIPGKHNWKTWKTLWNRMLDSELFSKPTDNP